MRNIWEFGIKYTRIANHFKLFFTDSKWQVKKVLSTQMGDQTERTKNFLACVLNHMTTHSVFVFLPISGTIPDPGSHAEI